MNTDIRLSTGFFAHPKIKKLQRKLGADAVLALLRLWLWAAQNRPGGVLSGMDKDDIEITADWNGEEGLFSSALIELRLIDADGDVFRVHNWEERNPWQAEAEARSEAARKAARARWGNADASKANNGEDADAMRVQCAGNADASKAQCPSPLPSSPLHTLPEERESSLRSDSLSMPDGPDAQNETPPGKVPVEASAKKQAKNKPEPLPEDSEPYRLAALMRDTLKANVPTLKEPDLQKWAQAFDVALRNDERMKDADFVSRVIKWACTDGFWKANIQSPGKLREKFDQLTARMQGGSIRSGQVLSKNMETTAAVLAARQQRRGFYRLDTDTDYGESDFGSLGGSTVGGGAT